MDTQVRFNPDKFGWGWTPGAASWVIPTAFAVLALRMAEKQRAGGGTSQERIQLGIEMLVDRACPGGGWNAGNAVAFGVALTPHIESTAIGLLALQGETAFSGWSVKESLGWLIDASQNWRGITSTAWAVLALNACRANSCLINEVIDHLATLLEAPTRITDNCALALAVLALDAVAQRNVFEVIV